MICLFIKFLIAIEKDVLKIRIIVSIIKLIIEAVIKGLVQIYDVLIEYLIVAVNRSCTDKELVDKIKVLNLIGKERSLKDSIKHDVRLFVIITQIIYL